MSDLPDFDQPAHDCRCGKVRFASKGAAKRAIRRMRGRVGKVRAYRCSENGWWHIGHPPGALVRGEISRADVRAREEA